MNWYEIVLGVVLIAVSVLIVVFTLAQEQKGQGLSGAIMGESSATMAAGRERGVDAKLAKLTKICGVVFFVGSAKRFGFVSSAPAGRFLWMYIRVGHRRMAVRRKLKEQL